MYLGPNGTNHFKSLNDDTSKSLENEKLRCEIFFKEYNLNNLNNDNIKTLQQYVNNNYISMQHMHNSDNVMRYCASNKSIPSNIITCGNLSGFYTEYKEKFGFWYIIDKKNDNQPFYREFEKYTLDKNNNHLPWKSDDLKNIFFDEKFEEIIQIDIFDSKDLIHNSVESNYIDNINDTDDYEYSYRYKSGYFEHDRYSTCSSEKSYNSSDENDNCDYDSN